MNQTTKLTDLEKRVDKIAKKPRRLIIKFVAEENEFYKPDNSNPETLVIDY